MRRVLRKIMRKCLFDAELAVSVLVMRGLDLLGPGSLMGRARAFALRLLGQDVGLGAIIERGVQFRAMFRDRVRIGAFTYVNRGCIFDGDSPITIGQRCDIGFNVTFVTTRHVLNSDFRSRRPLVEEPNPIQVDDFVWIGCNSVILGGVSIGCGSVVAAGSVVTKDVPPQTVVGGNPARIIRSLQPPAEEAAPTPVSNSPAPAVTAVASAPAARVVSRLNVPRAYIDGIAVDAFQTLSHFLDRVVTEIRRPHQTYIGNLNVHAANIARRDPEFRRILRQSDTVFCDGAGIVWASRLLEGPSLPGRFTAADFMPGLLKRLAQEGLTGYFLGSAPGVADAAMEALSALVPNHTLLGWRHGYLSDPTLNAQAIAEINALKPDILFVGMGMPLQERWVQQHRHQLDVGCIMPLGATLDYFSGRAPRCPQWMGELGMEWAFRLMLEPRRMFQRYVVGNPAFLARTLRQAALQRLPSLRAPQASLETAS